MNIALDMKYFVRAAWQRMACVCRIECGIPSRSARRWRRAFRRETIGATLAAVIASEPPPLLEAPPDAARIVTKMLAKKREGRYQSAEELLADLEAVAQPGFRFMPRRLWFMQKFRWLPEGAALLVLAAALIAGSIWWPRGKDAVASRPFERRPASRSRRGLRTAVRPRYGQAVAENGG